MSQRGSKRCVSRIVWPLVTYAAEPGLLDDAAGLLDFREDSAGAEDHDGAGGLAHRYGDRVGYGGDRRRRVMTGAKALGQLDVLVAGRPYIRAACLNDTIAVDDERPIQHGQLFNRFFKRVIEDVPLAGSVPFERIEHELPGQWHHPLRIPDHEHGSQGPALPALAAQLYGDIHDPFDNLRKHRD